MQIRLTWKKNFLSNLYNIYSNDKQIGKLWNKIFSQTANGELNGKEYTFKTKGVFRQHTEIIDNSKNIVIGEIVYNNWMTKAIISIDNKTIYWKSNNLWHAKWSIYNSEGIKIQYFGSSTSGQIDSNIDDGLLLLCGLFVTNYYWQIIAFILVTAFVPI